MTRQTTMWPDNRPFAFTIFDDTDWATVKTVGPVYDLLADLGILTSKSVWMFCDPAGANQGETCEDGAYRSWVLSLQRKGFEIGLHNAAPGTSPRQRCQRALDEFRHLFGADVRIHCNHTGCRENLYWGSARVSGWRQNVYSALSGRKESSRGHLPGDPLFWGDLCQERVDYVRNFVFDELNTLRMCPDLPYHDPAKPYVNYWFASADAGNLRTFLRNFTFSKIDQLCDEGGLCIMYTHFGGGFAPDGRLDAEFTKRMVHLASKGGWFAPVSTVLDYLRRGAGPKELTGHPSQIRQLERRWLMNKVGVEAAKRARKLLPRGLQ